MIHGIQVSVDFLIFFRIGLPSHAFHGIFLLERIVFYREIGIETIRKTWPSQSLTLVYSDEVQPAAQGQGFHGYPSTSLASEALYG
jgi:hypothetical protein